MTDRLSCQRAGRKSWRRRREKREMEEEGGGERATGRIGNKLRRKRIGFGESGRSGTERRGEE